MSGTNESPLLAATDINTFTQFPDTYPQQQQQVQNQQPSSSNSSTHRTINFFKPKGNQVAPSTWQSRSAFEDSNRSDTNKSHKQISLLARAKRYIKENTYAKKQSGNNRLK